MKHRSISADVAFLLVTLLLATGFGIYLSIKQVSDPFLYYDVAFVKSTLQELQMVIPEFGPFSSLRFSPGRQMLMVQFSNMMGVGPEVLQFLPLGSILLSLPLYYLALRLLKSPIAACLATVYLAINLSHAAALYSIFAYAFAIPFYLGLIIISWRLLERRGLHEILLALLFFVAVHLIHYTMTAWMILFLLGANVTVWLQKRLALKPGALKARPVYYLFAAFVVIYFVFNQTLYRSFFPMIGAEILEGALQRFISYTSLTPTATGSSPYLYGRSGSVGLVSTLTLLIILIPVAVGMLYDAWHLLVKRSPALIADRQLPTRWAMFVTGAVDSMAYTVRGAVSTKYFSMMFPLLMLAYVGRTGKRGLLYGAATLLVLTSVVKIVVFYEDSYVISEGTAGSDAARVRPSAEWLGTHTAAPRYAMLADLNLYGKYLLGSVGQTHEPFLLVFDLDQFEHVIGVSGEDWRVMPHVVAIDRSSSEPTMGFFFGRLDPLRLYTAEMLGNSQLNLIYDDGAIWLGRPIGE